MTAICYFVAVVLAVIALGLWIRSAYEALRPDYPQEVEGMLSRRW